MKIYDSNESDYNGLDSDSDMKVNLTVKSDETHTRRLWSVVYYNFRDNSYNKEGSFKFSPYHLDAYLRLIPMNNNLSNMILTGVNITSRVITCAPSDITNIPACAL